MRILVIGGSRFVGRHFSDAAVEAGHQVTHFNRGKSGELRSDVETITGDRTESLHRLGNGKWDWVLDTCGYVPRVVGMSAQALKDRVAKYAFVSTISVYSDFSNPITEDSPLASLEDESVEEITNETYGGLKVLCENVVLDEYGNNCLIVRPGMIVGPHDPSDRFTYWVWRAAQGTPMIAPGSPDLPMQFIHARDLGDWMLLQMQNDNTGTYNVTGKPTTFGELLEGADVRYMSGDEFREHGIEPGAVFAWFTEGAEDAHAWDVSIEKALGAGLRLRSVRATVEDTVAWANYRVGHEWKSGLSPSDEEKLLNPAESRV